MARARPVYEMPVYRSRSRRQTPLAIAGKPFPARQGLFPGCHSEPVPGAQQPDSSGAQAPPAHPWALRRVPAGDGGERTGQEPACRSRW